MAQYLIMFVVDSELTKESTETLKNRATEIASEFSKSFDAIVETKNLPLTVPEYEVAEQDMIGDMVAEMQETIEDGRDEEEDEECPECGAPVDDCECDEDDSEEPILGS